MVDGTGPARPDRRRRARPGRRPALRVCLDLDASWRPLRRPGARRRPPLPGALARAGRRARRRRSPAGRGFRLVGLMSYEAQIAGLGDAPPGRPLLRAAIRRGPARGRTASCWPAAAAAVAAVREHADLEFVNGGGTGSVAATSADPAVTEVTAGSGLYGPTLFDAYRAWRPTPAAFFACRWSAGRRPGWRPCSAAAGSPPARPSRRRLPRPWLPAGLTLLGTEGAGEVQTPLAGAAADQLRVGDRVWFRHAKAGELCEHVNELHLVDGDAVVATVPTYRGEGQAFL